MYKCTLLLKLAFTMLVFKFVSTIMALILVSYVNEVEGLDQFFIDFLKYFKTERPVFIGIDQADEDLSRVDVNEMMAFIMYTSREVEEVALYLHKLFLLGDLTMILFLNRGHQNSEASGFVDY